MQSVKNPPSVLTLLLILIALVVCATPSAAVPWAASDNDDHFSDHHRRPGFFPRLTWLRDTAIQHWWHRAPAATRAETRKSTPSLSHPSTPPIPASLMARYGGDVVLRFNLSTAADGEALAEAADTLLLDVWEFNSNWADIRLREDDIPSLLGLLPDSLHNAYSNLMPNLTESIYHTYPSLAFAEPAAAATERSFTPKAKLSGRGDNIFFQNYQPYSVIVPWMELMASMFTTHVRMISIGTTYEGREIQALRIGVSPNLGQKGNGKPRQTMIISGGFHAREWVSVSTATYIAWSLITSYGKSPAITKLLQEFDFVLIPTANPDGYVYTWETDRLWRKNRQQTSGRICRGLDLDRTFGFEWNGNTYHNNPCSESYSGDEPFQAVESHRLAQWAKNETESNGVRFVGFLDLHSYSQQVLYPYSYSCSADPPSLENLEELGMGLAKAIRISSGALYSVASACEGAFISRKGKSPVETKRMEIAGGSAIDWFYHEMRVRYSYQIKLRDTGSYGFLLPCENIVPTGEEAFNAVKYFGDFLLGNKGIESSLFPDTYQAMADLDENAGVEPESNNIGSEAEMENDTEEYGIWELRRKLRR